MKYFLLILFLFIPCLSYSQIDTSSHLRIELATGYRTFKLDDVNNAYSFQGFTKDKYKHTLVYSACLEYKLSNNRISLKIQYDFMPSFTRNNAFYTLDTYMISSNHFLYDSFTNQFHTTVKMQTATISITYEIPFRKILLYSGLGISYNTFLMDGSQYSVTYHRKDSGITNQSQSQSANYTYNNDKGFGLLVSFNGKYKLSNRLYLDAGLIAHISSFALRDASGNKIQTQPGLIGTSTIGFNYNRYLNVQLTGMQYFLGLNYNIF